jgi:hypothetical protein
MVPQGIGNESLEYFGCICYQCMRNTTVLPNLSYIIERTKWPSCPRYRCARASLFWSYDTAVIIPTIRPAVFDMYAHVDLLSWRVYNAPTESRGWKLSCLNMNVPALVSFGVMIPQLPYRHSVDSFWYGGAHGIMWPHFQHRGTGDSTNVGSFLSVAECESFHYSLIEYLSVNNTLIRLTTCI